MTRLRIIAAAAVASLAIAGCGGDDKKESASNSGLSYSEFGQQANDVCAEVNPQIQETAKKLSGKAQADAPVLDDLIAQFEAGRDRIAGLEPPSELQADHDRFLSLTDQQIDLTQKAQEAAQGGDDAAYQTALKEIQGSDLDEQSDEAASKMGAGECAN